MNTQAFASLHRFNNKSTIMEMDLVHAKADKAGVGREEAVYYASGFDMETSKALVKIFKDKKLGLNVCGVQLQQHMAAGTVNVEHVAQCMADVLQPALSIAMQAQDGEITMPEFILASSILNYQVLARIYEVDVSVYEASKAKDLAKLAKVADEMTDEGDMAYRLSRKR